MFKKHKRSVTAIARPYMKTIATACIALGMQGALAQDNEAESIRGEKSFSGTVSGQEVTVDYEATVKYRVTLFGGIKINANISDFRFRNLKYKGKEISQALKGKLVAMDGLDYRSNGYVYPKQGLFNFETGFSFIKGTRSTKVPNQSFLRIGWGSFDEYTYLEDEDVERIYRDHNITKDRIKDFYNLNVYLYDPKITEFIDIAMIDAIKEEMEKEAKAEEESKRKLKEAEEAEKRKKQEEMEKKAKAEEESKAELEAEEAEESKAEEELENDAKAEEESKAELEEEEAEESKAEEEIEADNPLSEKEETITIISNEANDAETDDLLSEKEETIISNEANDAETDDLWKELEMVRRDWKWGFIDKTGATIIPFIYDEAGYFSEGLAPVRKGDRDSGKFGFIDQTGATIIPFIYDGAKFFSEGLAPVYKDGWGFIDKTGATKIPFIYDGAEFFREGLAAVYKDGWGFIDKTGATKIPFIYDLVYPFSEGLALVKKDGKRFYINKQGEYVKDRD